MSALLQIPKNSLSFEAYLALEEEAEIKHEFVNGEVIEMKGASDCHELVALNLASSINVHMRGKGCRTYKSDMKLRFRASQVDIGYYPDVMVVCDPTDNNCRYKERPKLLIEVSSNFKKDHFEKLFIYQQIESLEEYLIVSQDPDDRQAWLYRAETNWEMPEPVREGEIHLESIDFTCSLDDIYEA